MPRPRRVALSSVHGSPTPLFVNRANRIRWRTRFPYLLRGTVRALCFLLRRRLARGERVCGYIALLQQPQPKVPAAEREQRVMRALLDDLAMM